MPLSIQASGRTCFGTSAPDGPARGCGRAGMQMCVFVPRASVYAWLEEIPAIAYLLVRVAEAMDDVLSSALSDLADQSRHLLANAGPPKQFLCRSPLDSLRQPA